MENYKTNLQVVTADKKLKLRVKFIGKSELTSKESFEVIIGAGFWHTDSNTQ